MVQWHKADLENRMYIPIEAGKKIAMPRYFKDKIYGDIERARIAAAQKNAAILREEEVQASLYREYGDMAVDVTVDRHLEIFRQMYRSAEIGRQGL